MNKSELVSAVAKETGLTKTASTKAVESIFSSITKTLKKGGEARFVGFGTFSVQKRKATTGRNPRTGEALKIPARKQPKFKPGKDLKTAVNK